MSLEAKIKGFIDTLSVIVSERTSLFRKGDADFTASEPKEAATEWLGTIVHGGNLSLQKSRDLGTGYYLVDKDNPDLTVGLIYEGELISGSDYSLRTSLLLASKGVKAQSGGSEDVSTAVFVKKKDVTTESSGYTVVISNELNAPVGSDIPLLNLVNGKDSKIKITSKGIQCLEQGSNYDSSLPPAASVAYWTTDGWIITGDNLADLNTLDKTITGSVNELLGKIDSLGNLTLTEVDLGAVTTPEAAINLLDPSLIVGLSEIVVITCTKFGKIYKYLFRGTQGAYGLNDSNVNSDYFIELAAYDPYVAINGNKFKLVKHPLSTNTGVLEVNDVICDGWWDNVSYWRSAVYVGGDPTNINSWAGINATNEITLN